MPDDLATVGPQDLTELRSLMAEIKGLESSLVLSRMAWGRDHGMMFGGLRDTYRVFGYDDTVTSMQYRSAYDRGGLAGRIIDVMPEATWRGDPAMELVEDEDPQNETEFEAAWYKIEKKHQINAKLLRVDKLSRISTYAVLLIGAPGDLSVELPRGNPDKLLYLMPFLGGGGPGGANTSKSLGIGADASVLEYDTDSSSPRFGLPISYILKRTDIASPSWGRPVHWTRILHVAEGLLDDEVFGQPALERVWNLLHDLLKVTGGGSEAFWLRANQGLHMNVDKDMSLESTKDTIEALKAQAEEYKHQLTRWLRTRGVDVTTLGSDVANFAAPADAIITQIAGSKAIPKRILTGSEMGELASSQDRENFRDQIIGRQTQYAGPYIARPLADRLIKYGYLPTPRKGPEEYWVKWPHIQVLTEQEKVSGAQGWASVNQTQGEVVFTNAEIRDKWAGYEPLTEEQKKEIADEAAAKIQQQQEAMAAAAPPEDKPANLRAAQEASHQFSSTQVQLPPALAEELLRFGKSIPAFDLCDEEGGLETDAHITVKYGIHTNNVADVRKALATYVGPIRITLGKTAIFKGDGYDVLYVEVTSPDLVELNQRLAGALEVTDTHPVYTPHATVGYLKSGLGVRYIGKTNLEGMSASIGTVRFSPAAGEDEDLRITGRDMTKGTFALASPRAAEEKEDLELLRVLTAAIENGHTDVVYKIVGLGDLPGHPFHGNQYTDGLTSSQTEEYGKLLIKKAKNQKLTDDEQRNYRRYNNAVRGRMLGGPGSGNYGHEGRPGHVGGSGEGSAIGAKAVKTAITSLHSDIKSEIRYQSDIDEIQPTYDNQGFEFSARYFGTWETPPDAEDDEDYDWQVPTKSTVQRLDKIGSDFEKRHPDLKFSWSAEEKNYITFSVRPRGIKTLGGPGSGNYGHAGRPGEVGGSSSEGRGKESPAAHASRVEHHLRSPEQKARRLSNEMSASERNDPEFHAILDQVQDEGETIVERENAVAIARAYQEAAKGMEGYPFVHPDKTPAASLEKYKGPVNGLTAERAAVHDEIVQHLVSKFHEPNEHPVVVITGGLPGAGKSFAIRSNEEYRGYLNLNADDIKAMLPDYKGTNAAFLHEESDMIAKKVFEAAVANRQNLILDVTMKSLGDAHRGKDDGLSGRVKAMASQGYEVQLQFTEVSLDTSVRTALDRYFDEGRFVPPKYIREARAEGQSASSKNYETFLTLRGMPEVKGWEHYTREYRQGAKLYQTGGAPRGKK